MFNQTANSSPYILEDNLENRGNHADRRQVLRWCPVVTQLSESLTKSHVEAKAGELPLLLSHTPGFLVVGLQCQLIKPRASIGVDIISGAWGKIVFRGIEIKGRTANKSSSVYYFTLLFTPD